MILVNLGTHLMIIDRNTYNILCEEDFSYPIVKLAVYNESTVLLGLADGSVERFWMDDRQKIFPRKTVLLAVFYMMRIKSDHSDEGRDAVSGHFSDRAGYIHETGRGTGYKKENSDRKNCGEDDRRNTGSGSVNKAFCSHK